MLLSKSSIERLLSDKVLLITPSYEIKAASVKAYLSGLFGNDKDSLVQADTYTLKPKGFVLAKAREVLTLPKNIAAFYDGFVGVASLGLFTHGSSMFIDPGETSQITLELFNASDKPIELRKDMRVGQYIFFQVG
jgi:dCTP deaminase